MTACIFIDHRMPSISFEVDERELAGIDDVDLVAVDEMWNRCSYFDH